MLIDYTTSISNNVNLSTLEFAALGKANTPAKTASGKAAVKTILLKSFDLVLFIGLDWGLEIGKFGIIKILQR